jgi:hypothetical protein
LLKLTYDFKNAGGYPEEKMKYGIKRENFDATWLEPNGSTKKDSQFQHFPMKEREGIRGNIKPALTEAILEHHLHSRTISGALERLGYKKAAEYFGSLLPKGNKTRKGNFGEVVASEHLCQRYGYRMPVFKLRFRDNPDMPMRGEDIVAFELAEDSKIIAICIGEAKTLEHYNGDQVKNAHKRLVIAYHPYPITLSLISNILHERGDHDLAEQIDIILETLALRPVARHNWLFIITGDKPHEPLKPIEEMHNTVENLKIVTLHLPRLTLFINEIFDNPGIRR